MRITILAVTLALASGLEAQEGQQERQVEQPTEKRESRCISRFLGFCTKRQVVITRTPAPAQATVDTVRIPVATVPTETVPTVSGPPQVSEPADTSRVRQVSTRQSASVRGTDRFQTVEACLSALRAGTARFYQPTYFKRVRLGSGERTLPLEHDACVRMQIVGSIAWVPQARGTQLDFRGTTPVRRTDCGNRVYEVVYPAVPLSASRTDTIVRIERTLVRTDTLIRHIRPAAPIVPVTQIFENPWPKRIFWAAVVAGGACLAYGYFEDPDNRRFGCISMLNKNEGIDIGPASLTGTTVRIRLP